MKLSSTFEPKLNSLSNFSSLLLKPAEPLKSSLSTAKSTGNKDEFKAEASQVIQPLGLKLNLPKAKLEQFSMFLDPSNFKSSLDRI